MCGSRRPFPFPRDPGKFNSDISGQVGAGYTDTYGRLSFNMIREADVTVRFLDADEDDRGELIPKTTLGPGPFEFIVDFDDVAGAGFDGAEISGFFIELVARTSDDVMVQKVRWPASAVERTKGKMLGQVMVHDVLIQDGSLNLSRQDLSLSGRGPQIEFSRTYSNQPAGRGLHPWARAGATITNCVSKGSAPLPTAPTAFPAGCWGSRVAFTAPVRRPCRWTSGIPSPSTARCSKSSAAPGTPNVAATAI